MKIAAFHPQLEKLLLTCFTSGKYPGEGNEMKSFKITYFNSKTNSYTSVIGKARSLEAAIAEEEKAVALFSRINPAISLHSVEAA